MTFLEFFNIWNGKRNVGNTTENTGQCVGLVAKWVDELHLPHIWGNACDLFVNADEKFFEKILNTPEAVPQAGDIVVWNKSFNGTVGHTGIATGNGDTTTFECFEQNDPLRSACHLKTYKYASIVGWLRPSQIFNQQSTIIVQQSDAFIAVATKLNVSANKDVVLAEIDKFIVLEDTVVAKDHQLSDKDKIIQQIKLEADTLTKQVADLSAANTEAQKAIAELQVKTDAQNKIILQLGDRIEELKQVSPDVLSPWEEIVKGLLRLVGRK